MALQKGQKHLYLSYFLKDENGNTAVSTEWFENLFRLSRQKGIAIEKIIDPLKRVYGESASQFITFPSS